MALESAEVGDRIDKMSQKIGMSAQGFQEWEYVLSQNGMEIDILKTGLNKLNNTVDDVISGNEAAAQKFERLGISIDDLKGKSREDIFNMTIEGLQGVSDESEKAAIASDLLGKSAVELAPLLNQSAESTQSLKDKANEFGMVMSDKAVAAAAAFTDSMDTLQRSFAGVKNSISAELLPGLTMITDGLTGLLIGQEGAAQSIRDGAQELVTSLAEISMQIVDIFASIATPLLEIAPDIIAALVSGLTENLPRLLEAAGNMVVSLLEGFLAALPQLTQGAVQLVLTLTEGILANLPALLEAAIVMIATLATGIGSALPTLIPAAMEAVVLLCQTLVDNLPLLMQAALDIAGYI